MTKKLIPIAIIIAGVLIAGAVFYLNSPDQDQKEPGETISSEILPPQEAAERAISFINDNILRGAAIASLKDVSEEEGLLYKLYKVEFTIEDRELESYITRDGKLFFPEGIKLAEVESITIGDFSVGDDEICKEDGKPIVYFFGSENCGYCGWEHPVIKEVAEKFKENIAFHNNMNSEDDMDIFQKYSTGGVPTLVLGCKYYRVGAGTQLGEEKESQYLTALICKLTENKPDEVCNQVQDLISQIEG